MNESEISIQDHIFCPKICNNFLASKLIQPVIAILWIRNLNTGSYFCPKIWNNFLASKLIQPVIGCVWIRNLNTGLYFCTKMCQFLASKLIQPVIAIESIRNLNKGSGFCTKMCQFLASKLIQPVITWYRLIFLPHFLFFANFSWGLKPTWAMMKSYDEKPRVKVGWRMMFVWK